MIRKAERKDARKIKEIADISFPGKRPLSWFTKYLDDYFIVEEQDSRITGFAILRGNLVVLIAVLPEFRRKGIATMLLDDLRKHEGKLFVRTRKSNSGALEFFASNSFSRLREIMAYYSNGDTAVEMCTSGTEKGTMKKL